MVVHGAIDQKEAGKEFPEETLALLPVEGFETVSGEEPSRCHLLMDKLGGGTGPGENPLPFFIFGDEDDEDEEDIEDESDFEDDDDAFEDDDDDFDDDDDDFDDDDYEDDEDDDYEYEEDGDYDDFDE